MNGPAIDGATIHIAGSTIRRIGKNVEIPEGATVIDAAGMTVTPGLIDADATLGMSYATRGGTPDPTNRAFDAFDRYATNLFKDAVRNGVTTLSIAPRTGSGITGASAIVRLQPGPDGPWAGVVVKDRAALCIDLGSEHAPTQRLETLDRVRKQFRAAVDYREALEIYKEDLEEYEKKVKERAEKEAKDKKPGDKDSEKKPEGGSGNTQAPDRPDTPRPSGRPGGGDAQGGSKEDELKKPVEPAPDRKSEVILKAIDREIPVRFRCETSADIFNALDLAREFSLDVILDGATEAYLIAPQLAKAEAKVVLGAALGRDFYIGDVHRRRRVGGVDALTDAGVTWIIGSGRGIGIEGSGLGEPSATRFVLANAQLVAQQSEREIDPLKLVTIDAAEFLGISDTVGSLAPGKMADIVIWSGDPLDPASRVREVYIGGELVYRDDSITTASQGGKR